MTPFVNRTTLLRNASRVGRASLVLTPSTGATSTHVRALAALLLREGYLDAVHTTPTSLTLHLRYSARGVPAIRALRLHSTPGRRLYLPSAALWQPQGLTGVLILSTSAGLRTDHEARQRNLGGEVLRSLVLCIAYNVNFH